MTTTEAETKPQEVADAAPAPSEPFTGSIPQQTGNIPDPFGDEKFDKIVDEAADKAMPEPKYEGPAKPWEEQSDVASTGSEGEAEGDGEGGAEAGTAPGQGQQKAAANEAEKSPDRATREQLVKARRALARDGWDDADIDNIQKSVGTERFIEKGQKAAERQRAIDRQQRDLHKNKDLAKQAQRAAEADPDDSPGRSGAEVSQAESEDAARPLDRIDQLVESGAILPEVADDIRKAHRSADQRVQMAEAAALQARAESRFAIAVSKLAEEFPGLKDDQRQTKVWNWISENDHGLKYVNGSIEGFVKHVRDGCYIEFGPEIRDQERRSQAQRNARARDNMPHPPGGNSAPGRPRAYTEDERDELAFEAIATSGTQAEKEARLAMIRPR